VLLHHTDDTVDGPRQILALEQPLDQIEPRHLLAVRAAPLPVDLPRSTRAGSSAAPPPPREAPSAAGSRRPEARSAPTRAAALSPSSARTARRSMIDS
jgi:hypothetical protein